MVDRANIDVPLYDALRGAPETEWGRILDRYVTVRDSTPGSQGIELRHLYARRADPLRESGLATTLAAIIATPMWRELDGVVLVVGLGITFVVGYAYLAARALNTPSLHDQSAFLDDLIKQYYGARKDVVATAAHVTHDGEE